MQIRTLLAPTLLCALLAACGGGGSTDSVTPVAGDTVAGVAATGAPVAGARIVAKCGVGTASTICS